VERETRLTRANGRMRWDGAQYASLMHVPHVYVWHTGVGYFY